MLNLSNSICIYNAPLWVTFSCHQHAPKQDTEFPAPWTGPHTEVNCFHPRQVVAALQRDTEVHVSVYACACMSERVALYLPPYVFCHLPVSLSCCLFEGN